MFPTEAYCIRYLLQHFRQLDFVAAAVQIKGATGVSSVPFVWYFIPFQPEVGDLPEIENQIMMVLLKPVRIDLDPVRSHFKPPTVAAGPPASLNRIIFINPIMPGKEPHIASREQSISTTLHKLG